MDSNPTLTFDPFLERIANIESSLINHWQRYDVNDKWLKERIEKLEKYISLIESLNNNRHDWMKPISELEDFNKRQIVWNNDICNWMSRIENMVDNIPHKVDKKPHKCPVCEGRGDLFTPELKIGMKCNALNGREICHSCEGKGIIWG